MTPAEKRGKKPAQKGFSAEEKAAAREAVRERKVDWNKMTEEEAERLVLTKIAEFPEPDRSLAKRVHGIVRGNAPQLKPRLWYGMPAYSKGDQVVCFFQNASKFKVRYSTLGFSDEAKLDEGRIWPVTYAVMDLTPAEEAKIRALVRRAVG